MPFLKLLILFYESPKTGLDACKVLSRFTYCYMTHCMKGNIQKGIIGAL